VVGRYGTILHAYEQFSAARAAYLRAAALSPRSFEWPYYAAHAALALGDGAQAAEFYARAAKLKPGLPKLEDRDAPNPWMDAIRDLNQSPTRFLARAQSAERAGDLAAAADFNRLAIERDPKLAQAYVNLISLYGRLNEPDKASEAYRESVSINPKSAEAHYNYGVLRYSQGRRAEAQAAFEKAIAADPGYAEAHHNLGAVFQETGRLAAAQRAFEKAVAIRPDYRLAHFQLGRLYANQHRYPAAIAAFERACTGEDEATGTYLYALGATYARAGRRADAVSTLERALDFSTRRGQPALAQSIERDLVKLRN
jgi:superkiller protein 3